MLLLRYIAAYLVHDCAKQQVMGPLQEILLALRGDFMLFSYASGPRLVHILLNIGSNLSLQGFNEQGIIPKALRLLLIMEQRRRQAEAISESVAPG